MTNPEEPTPVRRRLGRRVMTCLGLLLLIVFAAPYVIANTPLLNTILGRAGAKKGLRIRAKSAELGWFSPLSLEGLRMEDERPRVKLRVQRIQLDDSWFATWRALPDFGRIEIVSPEIELRHFKIPRSTPQIDSPTQPFVGELIVTNAAIRAFAEDGREAIIQLDHLDVAVRIESMTAGRILTIDPIKLLDHETLTTEMCDRGLQLVAPILANSTAVSGAASVEIQQCLVPLDNADATKQMSIAGSLQLHRVETSMKESIFRDIAGIVAGLTRVELPDAMRIADDTEVRFELKDGRVYHEGLSFLLPEISEEMVWRTDGSVGLDETLDIVVQGKLPLELFGDGPLANRLREWPIEFHIGGTLQQPQLKPAEEGSWLREASRLFSGEGASADEPPLTDTVRELLEHIRSRREENAESGGSTLLERMRERLKKARERRERRTPANEPPSDDGSI